MKSDSIKKRSAEEKLLDNGYENIKYLTNYSYDTALIGVTSDDKAVYDFDKMVEWLVKSKGFTDEEAVEWIEYNTIRALPFFGSNAPVIMYRLI